MTLFSFFPSLNYIRTVGCYTLIICCLLTTSLKAQTESKDATSVAAPPKIAFIDHSRVRGGYKALILAKDSVRREWQALLQQQNVSAEDKKGWHQKNAHILREYESKIISAIGEVVAKERFTDVKPVTKDSSGVKGVDITDMVLEKLNTKN